MDKRIRKLRKELDLTQTDFAKKIGTTASVITNYERGKRNPSSSVINNICKTFGVRESWLRTGEGEMFEEAESFGIDDLLTRCGVDNDERAMITTLIKIYFDLKPETRKDILDHFRAMQQEIAVEHEQPEESFELQRKRLHEELDRQLDLEKAQMDGASVSSDIETIGVSETA